MLQCIISTYTAPPGLTWWWMQGPLPHLDLLSPGCVTLSALGGSWDVSEEQIAVLKLGGWLTFGQQTLAAGRIPEPVVSERQCGNMSERISNKGARNIRLYKTSYQQGGSDNCWQYPKWKQKLTRCWGLWFNSRWWRSIMGWSYQSVICSNKLFQKYLNNISLSFSATIMFVLLARMDFDYI